MTYNFNYVRLKRSSILTIENTAEATDVDWVPDDKSILNHSWECITFLKVCEGDLFI